MSQKAVVIGAGVAGLAASIRLANKGVETHVYELNSFPGGKINSRTLNGYRFDQGPSLLTCPEYLEELYTLCGKDFSEFEMANLKNSFTYFFNDGLSFSLGKSQEEAIKSISDNLGEDPTRLKRYLDKAALNYRLISPLFIQKSLHRWRGLLGTQLRKALAKLPSYRLMSTMHQENDKAFSNPRTTQIFNRFAQYNGSHPYQAPAMLNMISHLEINQSPYLPKRGMIQITDALYQLAEEQGVQFHFNERVEEILYENKTISGIRTQKRTVEADFVISNMDVSFTYDQLLPKLKRPDRILNQEKSSSVLAFFFGMKKSFDKLGVHNMLFSDTDKEEFDAVFKYKNMLPEPSFYVYISSKAVPEDAPEGSENWFVLINAPINTGQNWEEEIQRQRAFVLKKMKEVLGEDVSKYIEVEETLDPRDIESRYLGSQGSIYGNASNNRFSAFYRHPNFSKQVKGLYFAGVSVHPGGGIPLALNSAKIACECLYHDFFNKKG